MGGDRGTLHQLLWWLSTRKPPKSRVKEMGRHLKVSNSDKPRGPVSVLIYLETYIPDRIGLSFGNGSIREPLSRNQETKPINSVDAATPNKGTLLRGGCFFTAGYQSHWEQVLNTIDKEVIFTVYNWIAFPRNKIDVPLAKPLIRTRRMILTRELRAMNAEKRVPLIPKNTSKYYPRDCR